VTHPPHNRGHSQPHLSDARSFDTLHSLSHPAANANIKLMSQQFVWPGVGKDCRTWTCAYTPCQQSKVMRHMEAPLESFNLPLASLLHVHIDLVGPLPVSPLASSTVSLPSTDTPIGLRHSLSDIPAEAVAKAFISVWVAHFGCSQQITTDHCRQFEALLFETLATITRSSLTRTTAWHPTSNGMIKRLHCQLKATLMCHADGHWAEVLLLVLLGVRSACKEDFKASSAELVYGSPCSYQRISSPLPPPNAPSPTSCPG